MTHFTPNKTRKLMDAEAVATATATPFPTFPGLDVNPRVFPGDLTGARIAGYVWEMTGLTTFTAADATIQHSDDGENWVDYKAFTQKTADGVQQLLLDETNDDEVMKYQRVEIDMTGTPGTATHTVKVLFNQCGAKGKLAPPGYNVRRN